MEDYSIRHIGLDIDFHHPESDILKVSREVEDTYGIDKEKAAIFTETASDETFNCEDLLDWYFRQSGKNLAAYMSEDSHGDAKKPRMAITFPIQFPANTFHMMTDRGPVDIKTLRLAVEVIAKQTAKQTESKQ